MVDSFWTVTSRVRQTSAGRSGSNSSQHQRAEVGWKCIRLRQHVALLGVILGVIGDGNADCCAVSCGLAR